MVHGKASVYEVSFENVDGYTQTEQEAIREVLGRRGLYGNGFAYVAFDVQKKDVVLATGTPHARSDFPNFIDCCTIGPLVTGGVGIRDPEGDFDLVHYLGVTADDGDRGAFAVYDLSQLAVRENQTPPHYQFTNPTRKLESLLAVVDVSPI